MNVLVEMAVRDPRGTKRLTVVKSSVPARLQISPDQTPAQVIELYHRKKLHNTFMPFIARGQLLAKVQNSGRKHYRPVLDLKDVHDNDTLIYHPCSEMQQLMKDNACLTPAVQTARRPAAADMNHTPTKTLKRKDRSLSEDRLRAFMQLSSSSASGSYMDPTESSRGSADDMSDDDLVDSHGQFMKPKLAKSSSKSRDVHIPPSISQPQMDMLSRDFAQLDFPADSDEDSADIDTPDIFMSFHPRRNNLTIPDGMDKDNQDIFLTSTSSRPSIGSPVDSCRDSRGSPSCLLSGPRKSRPSLESVRTSRPSSDFSMSDLTLDSFDENMCYYTAFSYRDSLRDSIQVRCDFEAMYNLGKQLGKGSYSTVYEATSKGVDARRVAVKVIEKLDVHEPRFLFREIEIMTSLNHAGIVQLFELYETPDHLYLVLELCGQELFEYIDHHGPLNEKEAQVLMAKLLRSVAYLHERAIVHRDIKPENILLVGDRVTEIKLSDFGIARRLHGTSQRHETIAEDIVMHTTTPRERYARAHTQCGTRDYIAPEVMSGKGYGVQADMWSVGVVLYVVLTGYAPSFTADMDLVFTDDCVLSSQVKDLMRHLLVRNPDIRWTAAQALQHPWINQQ